MKLESMCPMIEGEAESGHEGREAAEKGYGWRGLVGIEGSERILGFSSERRGSVLNRVVCYRWKCPERIGENSPGHRCCTMFLFLSFLLFLFRF